MIRKRWRLVNWDAETKRPIVQGDDGANPPIDDGITLSAERNREIHEFRKMFSLAVKTDELPVAVVELECKVKPIAEEDNEYSPFEIDFDVDRSDMNLERIVKDFMERYVLVGNVTVDEYQRLRGLLWTAFRYPSAYTWNAVHRIKALDLRYRDRDEDGNFGEWEDREWVHLCSIVMERGTPCGGEECEYIPCTRDIVFFLSDLMYGAKEGGASSGEDPFGSEAPF